jgi:uncharacterized membrane protein YecN with MAPEG domain
MDVFLAADVDATSIVDQPWFYPAVGSLIVAALVMMVWSRIPTAIRWLAAGIIITLIVLGVVNLPGGGES